MRGAGAWLLLLLLGLGCQPAHAQWLERTVDGIMGTRIVVKLWAEDQAAGEAAIDAVMADMRHVDETMSTFKPTSEVSKVNAQAADGPVPISPELYSLLSTALEYSRITEGAFDITYASVGYMYDFRAHVRPSEQQILAALPAVNYRHLLLDPKQHTVRFTQRGVRIDLGGIAKGWAVDRGIEILKARGFTHALVNAGGDSRVIGDRMGEPWVIGISDPNHPERFFTRIPLSDTAYSTSGDYERYYDENGVRYHHIIDPHTGHSASKVRSATVQDGVRARTGGGTAHLQHAAGRRGDPGHARRTGAVLEGIGAGSGRALARLKDARDGVHSAAGPDPSRRAGRCRRPGPSRPGHVPRGLRRHAALGGHRTALRIRAQPRALPCVATRGSNSDLDRRGRTGRRAGRLSGAR